MGSKVDKFQFEDASVLRLEDNDATRLCDIFRSIDSSAEGSVTLYSLALFLGVHETYCFRRIFDLFREDSGHNVDLKSFIYCVWNICTLTKYQLGNDKINTYNTS